MNRLRMFGVVKFMKDEIVTSTSWPKATLMRKVGFIDRTTGSFYPTEGIIQSVDAKELKICLLKSSTFASNKSMNCSIMCTLIPISRNAIYTSSSSQNIINI